MQCPRCQFENMPGITACFKCGSVLGASPTPVAIHPPRMARWKGPLRGLLRSRRQLGLPSVPNPLAAAPLRQATGPLLSIVPGIGHLVQRRFGRIWRFVLGWAGSMVASLVLYGSTLGMLLLGLAVVFHAWIILDAGLLEHIREFRMRCLAYLLLAGGLLLVVYPLAGRVLFGDITGGYANMAVPSQEVLPGDFLLARYSLAEHPVPRGSMVLTDLPGWGRGMNRGARLMGQVVGIPGDRVELGEGFFIVNGLATDPNEYPVPGWLIGRKFSVTIPGDHYFITAEYRARRTVAAVVQQASVLAFDQVHARAFMRWMPIWRRGDLRENE